MNNSKILISWIIIGRNWVDAIDELIFSLNSQNMNANLVELIIIDDASNDDSQNQFDRINFLNKKIIILDKHSGRTIAQNTGINAANGKYCLFTQSNTIPEESFANKYIYILSNTKVDGAAGIIDYTSEDKQFENYLKQFNFHVHFLNVLSNLLEGLSLMTKIFLRLSERVLSSTRCLNKKRKSVN